MLLRRFSPNEVAYVAMLTQTQKQCLIPKTFLTAGEPFWKNLTKSDPKKSCGKIAHPCCT